MKKYFNINYEFDQVKVDEIIFEHIKNGKPGYVCSLDGNNMAVANTSEDHLKVLNGAIVNNCDSSWIPVLLNLIHGTKYKNYCGTDLFIKYVKLKQFRQFFLGSTDEVLQRLKNNLSKIDPKINEMQFISLPYRNVEEFNYKKIGDLINSDGPDIIWVSLGAPKQEKFMSKLLPHLNKGVMFGFGAIFNFYAEMPKLKLPPKYIINLRLQWLYRLFQEPKKQITRTLFFLNVLPKLIKEEVKTKNKQLTNN